MSITYGDNLKHNNPLFPIVDVEDVKGGIRTIATFSNTDLYTAFNGAAISGGLVPGDIYQTLSNVLMVVV